jgi:hypothetical protein
MMRMMARLTVLMSAALLTGCVERRFVIESAPHGAQVFRNGQLVGFSPCDDAFVYYGKYHFTLFKNGYETLHVTENVRAPWYEYPPFDFIAENLVPWTIHDIRRLQYPMQPSQPMRAEDVLQRAMPLREEGRATGDAPLRVVPVPVPTPPPTATTTPTATATATPALTPPPPR